MDIAKSILAVTKNRGVKQVWIERQAGIAKGSLSTMIAGKKSPSLQIVEKIAGAAGMKVSEFIALGED